MVEPLSPLGKSWKPGSHGNFAAHGAGVRLVETRPGSIVEARAWPDTEAALLNAIEATTGLKLPAKPGGGAHDGRRSAFGIGPGRYLLADQAEGLAERLEAAVGAAGTVTDLSHGRTAFRISGARCEWVLSKLFAIDFSAEVFVTGDGRATQHHDVLAQIQRTAPDAFDLYVFRSLARSFWTTLCHAAEDVGYEVP